MKFGAVPPREAEGAIAVHSIRKDGFTLKKGTSSCLMRAFTPRHCSAG